MKKFVIQPSAVAGTARIPTSKSQSIRSILFATLAKGESHIQHYLPSPDIYAMMAACRQLGADIQIKEEQLFIVGIDAQPKQPDDVIDCGNSGQVLRFIGALGCLLDGYIILTGDHSIRHNRPVLPVIESLQGLGMQCDALRNDNFAPLIIKGPSHNTTTALSGEDSQPISGLLMALAFKAGNFTINVRNAGEKPWVDLTLKWLDKFNIQYSHQDYQRYQIKGGNRIQGFDYTVPGDLSSLAYPLVAALITQSTLTINGVDLTEPQGDKAIIDVAKRMGANITVNQDKQQLIIHKTTQLNGIEVDINDFIDCITIIAVLGCYARGTTIIKGAAIARQKESDRITAIATELSKMGAKIEERPDGLVIQNSQLQGADIDSYHDHRIVMSMAVAALSAQGETTINDASCVQKSFPNFIPFMQALGANIKAETQ